MKTIILTIILVLASFSLDASDKKENLNMMEQCVQDEMLSGMSKDRAIDKCEFFLGDREG